MTERVFYYDDPVLGPVSCDERNDAEEMALKFDAKVIIEYWADGEIVSKSTYTPQPT